MAPLHDNLAEAGEARCRHDAVDVVERREGRSGSSSYLAAEPIAAPTLRDEPDEDCAPVLAGLVAGLPVALLLWALLVLAGWSIVAALA